MPRPVKTDHPQASPSQVGMNVKARREALHITQAELAVRAGLKSAQHVAFIEQGRRKRITPQTLSGLAQGLECTTDELLAGPKAPRGVATEKALEEFIRARNLAKVEADAMRELKQVLGSRPSEGVLFRLLDLVREQLRGR